MLFFLVLLFFAGFFLGRFLKTDWIRKYRVLIVLTFLLLFALGVEIGSNEDVVVKLESILSSAFLISTFAVLGSFVFAVILEKVLRK
ncbi:LysO family transporter [Thermotoga caldifontis]|mgnify:CR=1 FL=1|uniref:LysO family transporter n=1 Tax=Thermotoga caldifontis TaxID=1508419 RepID=UPI0005978BE6|nr:LysO family transporter [Thermotoga caldifontis]